MISRASLAVVENALFPAGRAFVSQQVRYPFLRRLSDVGSLRSLWLRVPADGRLRDLLPKDEQAWDQIQRLRNTPFTPRRLQLDQFLADSRLESPAEEAFVREVFFPLYGDIGLGQLRSQAPFARGPARSGRVDFALNTPEGPVAIEIDGRTFHGTGFISEGTFSDQADRQNELARRGWRLLRYTATDVLARAAWVRTKLAQSLADLGWPLALSAPPDPAPTAGPKLTPPEMFLLRSWCALVPRIQRSLFVERVLEHLLHDRPVRILVPRGRCGAVAVALFDLIEVIEHAASLYGEPVPVQPVQVVCHESDDESTQLASELLNLYWERDSASAPPDAPISPRTARAVRWRVTDGTPSAVPPDEPFDLIVLNDDPTALDPPIDHAALARHLADDGIAVVISPTRTLQRQERRPDIPRGITYPEAPQEKQGRYFLRRFFGFDTLREGQWPILERAISGRSVLGVLPTGAGKSICFQLPALLLPGSGLVISPLVSLIEDQKHNLRAQGLDLAGGVNNSLSEEEKEEELKRFFAGTYKLFYISPERLQNRSFVDELRSQLESNRMRINSFIVDEAHLASEWGHDFRASYLRLPQVRTALAPTAPVVLVTATASSHLRADVLRMFALNEREHLVRPDGFDRPEISFGVYEVGSETEKLGRVTQLLDSEIPRILGANGFVALHGHKDGRCRAGGLVFTPWRVKKDSSPNTEVIRAQALARQLTDQGFPSDYYISTDSDEQSYNDEHKTDVQRRFKRDILPVVVATKGFGVGIDKPNVRYVVHTSYSGSLEGYYQEAGRCGRDRNDSHAAILWIRRHGDCTDYPPRCITESSKGECPYDLPDPCSFARQASMNQRNLPGITRELDQHLKLLREAQTLAKTLDHGGTAFVPMDTTYAPLAGRRSETLPALLDAFVRIGLIHQWKGGREDQPYFVETARISPKSLASQVHEAAASLKESDLLRLDMPELVGEALRDVAGLSEAEVHIGKLIWTHYLDRKWRQKRKWAAIQKQVARWEQTTIKGEHMLYRLTLLGVAHDYYRGDRSHPNQWVVAVHPYDPDRIARSLGEALSKLDRPTARIAKILERWHSEAAGKPPIEGVALVLALYLESFYEIIGEQRRTMLENMERFAATKDCRRAMILGYLGSASESKPEAKCGRCDNCAIEPLAAQQARAQDEYEREIASEAEARIQRGFDLEDPIPALAETLSWFREHGRLRTLRDRCARLLEDRPENLFGLLTTGATLAELGDRDAALGRLDRALANTIERGGALGCDTLLRNLPPELSDALITRKRAGLAAVMGRDDIKLLEIDVAVARGNEAHAQALLLNTLLEHSSAMRRIIPITET